MSVAVVAEAAAQEVEQALEQEPGAPLERAGAEGRAPALEVVAPGPPGEHPGRGPAEPPVLVVGVPVVEMVGEEAPPEG